MFCEAINAKSLVVLKILNNVIVSESIKNSADIKKSASVIIKSDFGINN